MLRRTGPSAAGITLRSQGPFEPAETRSKSSRRKFNSEALDGDILDDQTLTDMLAACDTELPQGIGIKLSWGIRRTLKKRASNLRTVQPGA